MLENPHGHGEGKPLSLTSGCKGTHTASQEPLDTCAGKLACGLHSQHNPTPSPAVQKLLMLLK